MRYHDGILSRRLLSASPHSQAHTLLSAACSQTSCRPGRILLILDHNVAPAAS
eukprot:XP_001693455.1 predicted protein [Chlamydomonas reinhardtii]